jgi:hypothetical protein
MEAQEKFDALIKEFGAEAVIAAIKGHVSPEPDAGCGKSGACQPGYYCSNGHCILDVG